MTPRELSLRAVPVAVLLTLAFAPGAARAQVDRADNEIAVAGSFSKVVKEGKVMFNLNGHVGHLLRGAYIEGLQLGLDANFSGPVDFSGGNTLSLFPTMRLYFSPKDPRLTPYVGLGVGLSLTKPFDPNATVDANVFYDAHGGLKYFLSPQAALFAQLDLQGAVTAFSDSSLLLSFGLSVFF